MRQFFVSINILLFISSIIGCTSTPTTYQGATIGGVVGAAAGVLIDKHNRWRGAVVGGTLGAILGGATTEIAQRASKEAAASGQKVVYKSTDGWQKVEADPLEYDQETRCHKVRERIWQNGKLVKDEIKEVCEGEKRERRY